MPLATQLRSYLSALASLGPGVSILLVAAAPAPVESIMSAEHAAELPAPLPALAAAVNDASLPIAQRMRAVFWLRTAGGDAAVDALCTSGQQQQQRQLQLHCLQLCVTMAHAQA